MGFMSGFFKKHPGLDEIRDYIATIVVGIIRLPFKVLSTIVELANASTEMTAPILKALGRFLLLPFNLLIGFGEMIKGSGVRTFGQGCVKKLYKFVTAAYRDRVSRSGVRKKLIIYAKTVKSITSVQASFLGDYFFEKICFFLAILPQVISSLTTYAGASIYMSGIADFVPGVFAFFNQAVLYLSTLYCFRPEKKKGIALTLLVAFSISVTFSYTGLSISNQPPADDYYYVYTVYEERFQQVKREELDKLNDVSDATVSISNAFSVLSSSCAIGIEADQALKDEIEKTKLPPETFLNRTRTPVRRGISTTTEEIPNPDYSKAKEVLAEAKAKEASLQGYLQKIESFLDNDTWKDLEVFLTRYLSPGEKGEEEQKEFDNFEIAFHDAVAVNQKMVELIPTCLEVELPDFTNIKHELRDSTNLSVIELKKPSGLENVVAEKSPMYEVLEKVGKMLGINLGTSMLNMSELRRDIQKCVNEGHTKIAPYLTENHVELITAKKEVDELKDITVVAVSRLADDSYRTSALVSLLLALLTDGLTILLGYAGTKKYCSFLYIRSSKSYSGDIKQLFGMVFQSMLATEYIEIRNRKYDGMNIEEFQMHCSEYVNGINQYIKGFLDHFSLSECTSSGGFNLCWHYKHDETDRYLPIISLLVRSNLLTIITETAYQEIEYKFHLGIEFMDETVKECSRKEIATYRKLLEASKESGYVLLLKSRAENFLRENIGSTIFTGMEGQT